MQHADFPAIDRQTEHTHLITSCTWWHTPQKNWAIYPWAWNFLIYDNWLWGHNTTEWPFALVKSSPHSTVFSRLNDTSAYVRYLNLSLQFTSKWHRRMAVPHNSGAQASCHLILQTGSLPITRRRALRSSRFFNLPFQHQVVSSGCAAQTRWLFCKLTDQNGSLGL